MTSRHTGWAVGVALAGMAAAGVLAFLPIWRRETIKVVFSGYGDPISDGIETGFRCAMDEAGRRAGRFRVEAPVRRGGFTMGTMPAENVEIHEDPQVLAVVSIDDLYTIGVTNGIYCVECWPNGLREGDYPGYRLGPGQACVLPPLEDQAARAARWCRKRGCRKIALIHGDGSSKIDPMARAFLGEAKESALTCTTVLTGSESEEETVARILQSKPDGVLHLHGDAPYEYPHLATLRKAGYSGVLMIFDLGAVPTSQLGTVPEGTLVVSPWVPPPPEYVHLYSRHFPGKTPDALSYAGYRATRQVLDALGRIDAADREAVQRAGPTGWPAAPECAGYVFKGGRVEFVELLK